jgi:outer membrane protein OmpA-like peptidoglycan-associated protein
MERAAAVVVAGTGLLLLALAALVFAGPDVADRSGGVELAAVVTGTPRPTAPATVAPESVPSARPHGAGIPGPLAALLAEISAGGIRFELGRADLDEDAGRLLDRLVSLLAGRPDLLVIVRGHTDSTGGPAVNGPLSVSRGQAVAEYLVAHGVPGGQLQVVGMSADQPVADNATDEGRRANRRSEISTVEQAG